MGNRKIGNSLAIYLQRIKPKNETWENLSAKIGEKYHKSFGAAYISKVFRGKIKPSLDLLMILCDEFALNKDEVFTLYLKKYTEYSKVQEHVKIIKRSAEPSKDRILSSPTKAVPLLGFVHAGDSVEIVEDKRGEINLDLRYIKKVKQTDELFATQVKGKSMEPVFHNGDMVLCRKNIKARISGKYYILRVVKNGEEKFTLKQYIYYAHSDKHVGNAINSNYAPIVMPPAQFDFFAEIVHIFNNH